ncbi:MAG: hypothetical protein AMK73_01130, partial [Planctomycetes bacterium SM23_32]
MRTDNHRAQTPRPPRGILARFFGGRGAAPSDPRRGAAMLIAIMVLAALFLLGMPFAVLMRLQHSAGTQALHTSRARTGDAGALNVARVVLEQGSYVVEAESPVFPFDNADVDTLWEFRTTLRTSTLAAFGVGADTILVDNALGFVNDGDPETVDGFLRVGDEWLAYSHVDMSVGSFFTNGGVGVADALHRGLFGTTATNHEAGEIVSVFPEAELWTVDIQDPQAKVNVNTAPYVVILNLLAYAGVDGVPPDDASFPTDRQRHIAWAIASYRTDFSHWENDYDGNDDVPDGSYTPFQNVSMLKNIAQAPFFTGAGGSYEPLSAAEFDLLRPYITVTSSHGESAERWWGTYALQGDVLSSPTAGTAETGLIAANLDNVAGMGVGTVVRFRDDADPSDVEYAIVEAKNEDTNLAQVVSAGDTIIYVNDARGFRQRSDTTPGYIFINDGTNPEWVSYSSVDTSGSPHALIGVEHDVWGGSPASGTQFGHAAGVPLDGCVISWATGYPLAAERLAGATTVEAEKRHALNINTVTEPIVLQSVLNGMTDFEAGSEYLIEPVSAVLIADALLDHTSGGGGPPYEFFDGDEDWFDGDGSVPPRDELEAFINGLGTVTSGDKEMLRYNLNADSQEQWTAVSTVPLRFNSGTLTSADVHSLAVADDEAGTPVARSAVARAPIASPRRYVWVWLSQQDFLKEMTRTLKHARILTHELNQRLDPADLEAESRYLSKAAGIGSVGPELLALSPNGFTTLLEGLHEPAALFPSDAFDLDYSVAADTAAYSAPVPSADNTTSQGITSARLAYETRYYEASGTRHVGADSFHATIQPLAVEFWIRPAGPPEAGERQVLFDLGEGNWEDDPNQLRVYLEQAPAPFDETWQLVVHVNDEISGKVQARSSVPDPVHGDPGFLLGPGEWHHVAVALAGTFKDEMALFIDGIYDRRMEWKHIYTAGEDTEAYTDEGYFWSVAMTVPLKKYAVSEGPDYVDPDWFWSLASGHTRIGLQDADGLPERGWVAINDTSALYEYTYNGTDTVVVNGTTYPVIQLVNPATLQESHYADEPVTVMVPVVQPAVHRPTGTTDIIQDGDNVAFSGYSDGGNGAFDSDATTGTAIVDLVMPNPDPATTTTKFPGYYQWLVFDPQTAADPIVSVAGPPIDTL